MIWLREAPDLRGRRVTVMGLGLFGGGLGAARFLASRGAKVTVTDQRPPDQLDRAVAALRGTPVDLHLGGHRVEDFAGADLVLVNPAVTDDSPFLRAAQDAGVPLETEINLFWKLCPSRRIVGITGSNGKTTTAALVGEGLRAIDVPVRVGGNIGGSLLESLDAIGPTDAVVLELSSFQLERLAVLEPRPAAGVVTNLVPNHLDRHGTMEAYGAAKEVLVRFQQPGQARIVNADDPGSRRFDACGDGRRVPFGRTADETGVRIEGDALVAADFRLGLGSRRLRARFHLANMAAAAASIWAVAPRELAWCLGALHAAWTDFPGVPHRLELVAEIDGVRWFNDSIATNPDAAAAAIENTDGGIVLIAGGFDKKIPFDGFGRAVAGRVRLLVTLGETAAAIEDAVARAGGGPRVVRVASLEEAVEACADAARPGESVLLSPACASYGMFRNFEERGDLFRSLVRGLNRRSGSAAR